MPILYRVKESFRHLFGVNEETGFGSGSTSKEVADKFGDQAKGRVFLVTGANAGIGKATVRNLVRNGAHVVVACRSIEKAQKVCDDMKEFEGENGGKTSPLKCDLMSFASVRSAVEDFKGMNLPLHVLINNAGIMGVPKGTTEDGHEMHFGVNHLAHYLLTELLLPKLRENKQSRVVLVGSEAHRFVNGMQFDDINMDKNYSHTKAYGQSKLSNLLHALELAEREKENGVSVFSVHPGVIAATNLGRHFPKWLFVPLKFVFTPFFKSIEQGAATTVYTALAPGLEELSGKYFYDCHMGYPTRAGKNMEDAKKLKAYSDKVTM